MSYLPNESGCSIAQLVDLALGEETCQCVHEGKTMAHCLDALPSDALHGFFQACLNRVRAMPREQAEVAAETLRRRLGMWYSTGVTTVLDLAGGGGGTEDVIGKRMNALAVEALRWVDSSFLAHVVLWSRELAVHQFGVEELLVSTAVAMPPGALHLEDAWQRYDLGLRSYVGEYGSTVRRDVHLQQVRKHIGSEEYPSLRSDGYIPRITGAGQPITLCLPPEPDKLGSDKEWRALLEKELSSSFGSRFEFLQLAAGSDSWYADHATRVGAVAHLYLVSPEKKEFAREYVETMREHLSRLALEYSTAVIRDLRELAVRNARLHEALNEVLTRETKELDQALKEVESRSRRLRVLVATNMWDILLQWIRELGPLFKTGAPVPVCGCTVVGEHIDWEDIHYLAALLMLAGERTDGNAPPLGPGVDPDSEAYKTAVSAYLTRRWIDYAEAGQAEGFAAMTQVNRCLARLGILAYRPHEDVGPKGSAYLNPLIWKAAFTENPEEILHSPSILVISFCMGARFDTEYPPSVSTPWYQNTVSVASPLQIKVVASGLCKLLEALCENSSVGLKEPLTVRMDTSGKDFWSVRLSPVSITEETSSRDVYLIDDDGLTGLFRTAGSFVLSTDFPWTSTSEFRRETTQALFRALGQDEISWLLTTRSLHTGSGREITVVGEGGRVIARIYTRPTTSGPELWVELAKK